LSSAEEATARAAEGEGLPIMTMAHMLVQKYGGSSLATAEQLNAVADRVSDGHRSGRPSVVVVSARGTTTDDLLRLAGTCHPHPPANRELDQLLATGETASAALLALALQARGVPATALSGAQTGILATGRHGSGVIAAVDTERTRALLDSGSVVVMAGFQGVDAAGDVITLGRGGSDTTAVAVASELGAGHCDIYTDVDGVYTADPRIVPDARVLTDLRMTVLAEMALAGARVMHSRAVELAAITGVDIRVRHSGRSLGGTVAHAERGGEPYTTVRGDGGMVEARGSVAAVVHDTDTVRVSVRLEAAEGAAAAEVFRFLARESIVADMTALGEEADGRLSVAMTVSEADVPAVSDWFSAHTHGSPELDRTVGKVSVIGTGLLGKPQLAARTLDSLAAAGIPASSVATSQLRISITVARHQVVRAVQVLHSEFGLESDDRPADDESPVPA
jgi:aspartate kinase